MYTNLSKTNYASPLLPTSRDGADMKCCMHARNESWDCHGEWTGGVSSSGFVSFGGSSSFLFIRIKILINNHDFKRI